MSCNGIRERKRDAGTAPPPARGSPCGFALVLLAAVVSLVVGLLVGPAQLSFADVAGALGRRLGGAGGVVSWRDRVVIDVRLPRVLVGFLAGGALAVAGAALQGLFRNPLAEPGVLGISSGASLGAVLAIYFKLAGRAVWTLPAAAFLGAAIVAVLVFAIAARQGRGRVFTSTLLLVGVARDGAERVADDVRAVGVAGQLRRRAGGDVLAAGRAGRAHLGPPAAGRAGDRGRRRHHRGARARPGRAAAGRDRRAVGRRRRAARADPAGAGQRAGGRRGGRGRGADRVRRPAGPAPAAAGDRAGARRAGAAVVRGRRRVPGDRGRGRARSARAEMPVGVITAAVGAPVFLALLMRRRVEVAGP